MADAVFCVGPGPGLLLLSCLCEAICKSGWGICIIRFLLLHSETIKNTYFFIFFIFIFICIFISFCLGKFEYHFFIYFSFFSFLLITFCHQTSFFSFSFFFHFPLFLMVFHCFSLIFMLFLDFRCHGQGKLKK